MDCIRVVGDHNLRKVMIQMKIFPLLVLLQVIISCILVLQKLLWSFCYANMGINLLLEIVCGCLCKGDLIFPFIKLKYVSLETACVQVLWWRLYLLENKSSHRGTLWLTHLEAEHCCHLSHWGHTPIYTHQSLNRFPICLCPSHTNTGFPADGLLLL